MLQPESNIFFRIPENNKVKYLQPAHVLGLQDSIFTAEIPVGGDDDAELMPAEGLELDLSGGQEVLVYFEHRGEFMQQPACIETTADAQGKLLVGFRTIGEPMSAERRQCYRVSTLIACLEARLGEHSCHLVDVSVTGFAVITDQEHSIGTVLPVTLFYEGMEYSGEACVQSTRKLTKGRMRYGLHAVVDKSERSTLQAGLVHISMAVQREQLRRMSGSSRG